MFLKSFERPFRCQEECDAILPLVLTQSSSVAVLPLGLTKLEGQYAINVPAVMAAVLLSVLPLVVLFIVMRKQVMRSLGSVVMR